MIRNLILTLSVMIFAVFTVNAQQEVFDCPDAEEAAICDLDQVNGYTFTNPDPANANPPGGDLCGGGVFNNPGWFSFVAGSESIEVTVIPVMDPVTGLPMCDTIQPGGQTGIQVALWEGCPETSGTCVAGDANCSDQPVTLSASGLTIGEIYNLVIDGCAGSVCTVMVQVDQSQPFDIPDVDEVDLFEPEYNVRGGCDSALPDGVFCAGIEILVSVDNEVYENLGAEFTWTIESAGGNADPSTVEWSSGSFSGTGSPAVVGELCNGCELGASVINFVFMEPGVYEICLTEVDSECDDSTGEVCVEITIIQPGDQDFGEYDVCVLDLLAGWDNNGDLFDEDGNPWGAGEIDLQQVLSAPDGLIEVMVQDDCGCEFNQFVKINPVGSLDREQVDLFLLPCQLPYLWFDIEIDEMEEYENYVDIDIIEGSAQRDHEGQRCDSLISLLVVPLVLEDSITIGDCTPMGTEFSFEFFAIGPDGNEMDFNNVTVTWIDSTTNMPVGMGETVFLNSGTYYVSISSTFEDPNYTDDLAGIDPDDDCEFVFGPYTLMGGSASEASVFPYDTTRCTNDLNNIVFVADTIEGTTYNWMVPPGIPFTVNMAGDSLTVDWTNATATDTIKVSAANDCGESEAIALPLEVIQADAPDVTAVDNNCISDEFIVEYNGDQSQIMGFTWDFGTGIVTTGDPLTGGPLGVTFPASGSYTYFLTITDLDGCQSSEMFDVTIEDPIEAPVITCVGDPTQIVFSWNDVGADDYMVNEVVVPMGATGTPTGLTEFTVTGLSANDEVIIEVIAISSTSCGNVSTGEQSCFAADCNLTGIVNNYFPDNLAFCQNHPDNQIEDFDFTLPGNVTGLYSGNGIIDAVEGLFDPNDPSLVLGQNEVIFTYMDDADCEDSQSIMISINEIPVADFAPSAASVCQDEVLTLDNFNNDPNAVWDYGQDAVGDFTGLSYTTPGMKEIKLVVIDPMTLCGDSITQQVEVRENIVMPSILCSPGIDSVYFNWDDVIGVSSYDVEVSVNGTMISSGPQTNSDWSQQGLNEGDVVDIQVTVTADNGCGMFIVPLQCEAQTCYIPTIQLTSLEQIFCSNGDLSPVAIDVQVDFTTATGIFEGPGISDPMLNEFDPALAGTGNHTVIFSYTNPGDNCVTQDSISFSVFEVPDENFVIDQTTICIDETATITYSNTLNNYNPQWVLDNSTLTPTSPTESVFETDIPSDYTISLTYGIPECQQETVMQTITVVDTITYPSLRCENAGTDFIEFGWNDQSNVDEYEIYFEGNLVSTQAGTSYMLTGLESETSYDLTVVAVDNECGSRTITITCETPTCVPPTFTENIPGSQCYDAGSGQILLDVNFESNTGIPGSYVWDTPLVDASNMFTPIAGDQDYTFDLIYTEGNCTTIETVNFSIVETPPNTLDMSVDNQVICINSSISVTAQDPSLTDEFPNWDFGDPSNVTATGIGFGPYELTFDQAGTYNISLIVDNEGCLSSEEMVTIVVEDELIPPTLTCENEQVFSLDFSWDAVDCASDYVILVDGSQVATVQNTSYSLTNLNENQSVNIQVEAISDCACESVMSAVMVCSTTACPTTSFSVSSFETEVCLDATASPFNISITPDDLPGNGNGSWTGDPISTSGMIDPSTVGPGTYQLSYAYSEDGCDYNYSTEISFVEAPTVNVVDQQNPLCESDNFGYISVDGTGGTAAYMYSINQGAMQSSGEFADVVPGSHTINIVDANGCINSTTVNISAAPVVSASISGPTSVILDNDATYTIDTNAPNIDYIVWTVNGVVACEGPNCTEYTIFQALSNAEILVQVFYNNACLVEAQLSMTVKEIQAFFIPDIFTPSSGDVNSTWTMFTKGSETFVKSVKIYNRWGNLVHTLDINDIATESRKSFELWDGYIEDDPAVTEVYVYLIDMEIEGIPRVITGSLTVIR